MHPTSILIIRLCRVQTVNLNNNVIEKTVIDKIIYIYASSLWRKAFDPHRIGFIAALLPKIIWVLAIMRLLVGEDGYVHYNSSIERAVCYAAVVAFVLNGWYVFHFSSLKNYDRTENEVREALRLHPFRWKILIAVYLAATAAFAVYVHYRVN